MTWQSRTKQNCKWLFIAILLCCFPHNAIADSGTDKQEIVISKNTEIYELSLEDLAKFQVYTANRELTPLEESPSVVSLITAADIKQQGLKSLDEVLQRIPGFFMQSRSQVQPFISHRGIIQDQNLNVLLLFNGHPQNMKYAYGVDTQHIFPLLSHIKRIEVVRGSSSTLWGSQAATAVINIITYKGSDLDQGDNKLGFSQATYDYQSPDDRHITNLLLGKQFNDAEAMLSYTFTESNADIIGYTNGSGINYSPWETFRPSHELFFTGSWQDFSLQARHARLNTPNAHDFAKQPVSALIEADPNIISTNRESVRTSLALGYNRELSTGLNLELSLSYDDRQVNRFKINDRTTSFVDEEVGFESLLRHSSGDWRSLLGLVYDRTDFKQPGKNPTPDRISVIPDETETIFAGFVETEYSGIKDLLLTAGVRVEHDDLRTKSTNTMPRFSAVYRLNPKWSAKYAFSTGIVRPPRVENIGDGTQFQSLPAENRLIIGTNTPEKVQTQELQFSYDDTALHAAATFFNVDVTDMFIFVGQAISTGPPEKRVIYGNIDEIRSRGLELELDYRPIDVLKLYANFTLQDSEYRSPFINALDGEVTLSEFSKGQELAQVPDILWNAGLQYSYNDELSMNLHYRGFEGVLPSNASDTKEGAQHYLDMNLVYKVGKLDLSIYAKNLLDNTDHRNHPEQAGGPAFADQGRAVGFRLSYALGK